MSTSFYKSLVKREKTGLSSIGSSVVSFVLWGDSIDFFCLKFQRKQPVLESCFPIEVGLALTRCLLGMFRIASAFQWLRLVPSDHLLTGPYLMLHVGQQLKCTSMLSESEVLTLADSLANFCINEFSQSHST